MGPRSYAVLVSKGLNTGNIYDFNMLRAGYTGPRVKKRGRARDEREAERTRHCCSDHRT